MVRHSDPMFVACFMSVTTAIAALIKLAVSTNKATNYFYLSLVFGPFGIVALAAKEEFGPLPHSFSLAANLVSLAFPVVALSVHEHQGDRKSVV